MTTDFLLEFRNVVVGSKTDEAGIKDTLAAARPILDRLDSELVRLASEQQELLAQRYSVNQVMTSLVQVRNVLVHGETVSDSELSEWFPPAPVVAEGAEQLRVRVLRAADSVAFEYGDGVIANVEELVTWMMVGQDGIPWTPPWSNPNAAVSTILNRSDMWMKQEPGVYARKEAVPGWQ